jgi:hypothetical protein
MKKSLIFLYLILLCSQSLNGQYYDKKYVRDLRHRLFIAYFQEYRSLDFNINPNAQLDQLGKEKLRLSSASNLFSGILIQGNSGSLYLAKSTPQTPADISRFGKQKTDIYKVSFVKRAFVFSANYIKNRGFYDKNYLLHPEFVNDSNSFKRYNDGQLTWLNIDVGYYKNHRQFAIGLPNNYGLRQLKTKAAIGSSLSFNSIELNNKNKTLFRDSLSLSQQDAAWKKINYNGFTFSLIPGIHLVAMKKHKAILV